jgi:cytochrome c553
MNNSESPIMIDADGVFEDDDYDDVEWPPDLVREHQQILAGEIVEAPPRYIHFDLVNRPACSFARMQEFLRQRRARSKLAARSIWLRGRQRLARRSHRRAARKAAARAQSTTTSAGAGGDPPPTCGTCHHRDGSGHREGAPLASGGQHASA